MGSFVHSLSDQPLTSRDKRMLLSPEFSKELAARSNERLFELGLREVDEEIAESKAKSLKKAKVYRIARIVVNLVGVALICIVPVAIIFNLPIWVPIVVTLVGGITLGIVGNALKSREQLLRLRHKSLLQYRQRLAKKLYVQSTWKNIAAKNKVNNKRSLSERMKIAYKEFGIDNDSSSSESFISESLSPLNLDTPLFLHRYESGVISKDTQTILKSWKLYQREVLKIKSTKEGQLNTDANLIALRDRIYSEGGIVKDLLPVPNLSDGLSEIKSFCSYGLQVSDRLQDSLNKYQLTFPLLSLVSDTKLGLDFKIDEKKEELSLLSNQLQHYLSKLSKVKTEEEAISVIEELSSLGILSQVRKMINSSLSLNSSILSKISFHPTNRILFHKQRLSHLKLEVTDPLWASDWFNSSTHDSWKDKILKFCSCCKKEKMGREEVRQKLLNELNDKENLLLELETMWCNFLNNDFAKLHLEASQETLVKLFKDVGENSSLNTGNLKQTLDKIKDLKMVLSEEMIGADNESAAQKILEITEKLNDFEDKHLLEIERLIVNRGDSSIKFVAKSLTTRNSTFRRRQQETEKEYKEKISFSGNLESLSKNTKTLTQSYLESFKELLNELEHIEKNFSEELQTSKETELLNACQKVQNICQKFSLDDINYFKSHLSTLTNKLNYVSDYKKNNNIDSQSNILNHLSVTELEKELSALEKQFRSERKEVDEIRERCRTTLDSVLENIEKQSVNIYLGQAISNIVLSVVFFVIMAILGIFLVSFNVWWVHLIFLGVSIGFIGINFLLTYLIGLRAKEKLEVDLQKDFLISSEIKTSTYPNPDLDQLKKLQAELGLDGVHPTWAKKEFLDEHSNSPSKIILNKSKEEVIKELKVWHKELKNKNIPNNLIVSKEKVREELDSEDIKKLKDLYKDIYIEHGLLEKSIASKETLLNEVINEKLIHEHEFFLLEKEYVRFIRLNSEVNEEKKDIQKKQELLSRLKTKHQFLTNVISTKKEEFTQETIEQAQLFFKELLSVYQDTNFSESEKKEKIKPIIKNIYSKNSISLVQELIEKAYSQRYKDRYFSYESSTTSFQERGLLWDSPLKENVSLNIQYLKHFISYLGIIQGDARVLSDSPEFIEAVRQANLLIEEFPVFLKEVKLFSIFTPCPRTERAREISLEIENAKKEIVLKDNNLMTSSLTSLHSIFSSLLKKLIKKDSIQIEKASFKLDQFLSSTLDKSQKLTEKDEKKLVEVFENLPLHVLKNLEKNVLLDMSRINVSLHIFKSKLEKVAYIESCLNKEKKETISLEMHRKILNQKKEKEILEKRKLVKTKLREIEELQEKKLIKEKVLLNLETELLKAKILKMKDLEEENLVEEDILVLEKKLQDFTIKELQEKKLIKEKEFLNLETELLKDKILKMKALKEQNLVEKEILILEKKLQDLTTEKKLEITMLPSTRNFNEIFSPKMVPHTYECLLTKMTLSRKEVQRFFSLYEKERKKDPIHANHMKRMHKQSKIEYEKYYKDLISGVSDDSLIIPQHLNTSMIRKICTELLKNQNLLENIERELNDLSEEEDKVFILQEKIGKMEQRKISFLKKISQIEKKLLEAKEASSLSSYEEKKQRYEEQLLLLEIEINEHKQREDDLKKKVSAIDSVRAQKQDCLETIKELKQQFFNEQQRS